MNKEIIELAEKLQQDCINELSKDGTINPKIPTKWLFTKLAEMQLRIDELESKMIPNRNK